MTAFSEVLKKSLCATKRLCSVSDASYPNTKPNLLNQMDTTKISNLSNHKVAPIN